jgi:hypothetical protein
MKTSSWSLFNNVFKNIYTSNILNIKCKKKLEYHVVNKFTNIFLFKLTYNLCEFNNVLIKSLIMLLPFCKINSFFEEVQAFIFPSMIRYKIIYLFLQCC